MNVAQRVAYNTAVQVLGRALAVVVGLVSFALIARHLGAEGLGTYALILALVPLLAALGDLGVATIGVREISRDRERTAEITGQVLALKLSLAVAATVVFLAVIPFLPYEEPTKDGLGLAVAVVFATLMAGVPTMVFQSRLRMDIVVAVEAGTALIGLGLLVAVIERGLGLNFVLGAWIASATLAAVVSYAILLRTVAVRPRFDVADLTRLLRVAAPLGLVFLAGFLHFRIDAVLLSLMKPFDDVGIYGVAYKYLEQALLFPGLFMASVFPVLTVYAASRDERLQAAFEHALTFLMLVGIPLALGSFVLADGIVALVGGEDYTEAAEPLRILVFATLFVFANVLFLNLLIVYNRQTRVFVLSVAAVVLNVALNLLLIPPFTYSGAATATVVTEGLTTAVLAAWAVTTASLRLRLDRVPRIVVASAAMGVVMFATRDLPLAVPVALGAASYAALVYVLGVVTGDELRALVRRSGAARPSPGPSA